MRQDLKVVGNGCTLLESLDQEQVSMSRKVKEQAAISAARQIKARKRRGVVWSAIGVALLASLAYGWVSYTSKPVEADAVAAFDTSIVHDTDILFGKVDAPVRITEYASLTCPHCAEFHKRQLPAFLRDYVDTGKAYLVFRHFPYDRSGLAGAELVSCLPASKRASAVSAMMADQAGWVGAVDPAVAAISLMGLDQATAKAAQQCASSGAMTDRVGAVTLEARDNGISSTPTFVIDDKVYAGSLGSTALGRLIDARITAKAAAAK
jgi:protein-disulfide isomerase